MAETQPFDEYLASIAASTTGVSMVPGLNGAGTGVVAVEPAFANVGDVNPTGDGVADDAAAFNSAKAANKLVFIPKPATAYNFGTAISTDANAWFPDPTISWADLTDSGNLNMWRGRATDLPTGSNIWRFSDRVFIGYAASAFAGNSLSGDEGASWLGDPATAPSYLAANAGALFLSGEGDADVATRNQPYGFVSGIKTSTIGQGGIAFGAVVVADEPAVSGWAFIAELQRESGSGQVYGLEIGAKNKGSNGIITPNTQSVGVFGVWAAGGGDDSFGGASVNPSTAAMVVLNNTNTWNSGIVMMKDALTNGEAIALSSEGVGGAHAIRWYNAAGNVVFNIRSTATDSVQWRLDRTNSGVQFFDGATQFNVAAAASAVNYLEALGGPSGSGGLLRSVGSDSNQSARIRGKGTGGVQLQDGASSIKFSVNTTGIGFFGAAPVAKPTGVTVDAAGIHAALVTLGLIAA